jgi:PPK2 family polyphosphate:nucleotide phosphotransferase
MWKSLIEPYLVKPGSRIDLSKIDADDTDAFPNDKEASKKRTEELNERLRKLQELLFAESKHRILIVLQGMDTSGKDGTVKRVFQGINPLGVRVHNFRKPSSKELSHDFLWRIHEHAPSDGEIVMFNRSHYEDVTAALVRGIIDKDTAKKRREHIKNFEKMLTDEGSVILKFFLNISKDEQADRLKARRDTPHKQWKFNHGDLEDRKLWDEFLGAYSEAISETSTKRAPWFIVPANSKWFRNWLISEAIVEALESLEMKYPKPKEDISQVQIN